MQTETTELYYKTATELTALLQAGELSCVELLESSLQRIESCNARINAIVSLDAERALEQARRSDAARKNGEQCGPLFGLPVAHKDLALTKGLRTTFGSVLYADHIPDTDSLIVSRMRHAGAITLGKTNTPEFGAGSHTFNAVFGTTVNPFATTLSCGGSSGGAAAALAAGMVSLADGSDMGGSLRNPAGFCNVVGLRPTPGRVPVWPNELAWFTLGVEGPMARTVEDVALFLSAIAGPDSRSPLSLPEAGSHFTQSLEADFKNKRIAYSPDFAQQIPVVKEISAVLDGSIGQFVDMGLELDLAIPDFSDADQIFKTWRAWAYHASLSGLSTKDKEQLKQTVREEVAAGEKLSAYALAIVEKKRTNLFVRVMEFMQYYDYLLLPVTQVEPFNSEIEYPTEINGMQMESYIDWMRACYYISVLGLPAISVPAGFSRNGLPVGLQIVGKPNDEIGLLQLAYAFQQQTRFCDIHPNGIEC